MNPFNLEAYYKARPDVAAVAKSSGRGDAFGREHASTYGVTENVVGSDAYKQALAGLNESDRTGFIRGDTTIDEETRQQLLKAEAQRKYGGGMSQAELGDFNTLIDRLEASKNRQQGELSRGQQRQAYATGLAQMMGNF